MCAATATVVASRSRCPSEEQSDKGMAMSERDAGFCSGGDEMDDSGDEAETTDALSPTDASEDSVEVTVRPIRAPSTSSGPSSGRSKRKSAEPRRMTGSSAPPPPKKRRQAVPAERPPSPSPSPAPPGPFRPWGESPPDPPPPPPPPPADTPKTESSFSVESLLGAASCSSGAASTSLPQRNYKNMTRERRIEANARERTRVHTISAAFDTLRRAIPAYSHSQKLSKLSVLRIACSYILTLSRAAGCDYSADASEPSLEHCVDLVTRTIHTEGKLRRKRDD